MKLNQLVVASMSVLGLCLLSSQGFAAEQAQTEATTTATTTTKHKVVHHRVAHVKHHYVARHMVAQTGGYKPMGCVPMQPCVVQPCVQPCQPCVVDCGPRYDAVTSIVDGIAQAYGRTKPCPDWYNRIGIAGGVNFDAHWGNLSRGYMGENVARLSVNDAYLNVHAIVNDWTSAFASVSFSDPSVRLGGFGRTALAGTPKLGKYSNVYNYAASASVFDDANTNRNAFNMEQAYITVANFNCTPFFLRLGKQYSDFSRYEIHPITRTMTQVLSESLRTSAQLGFVTRCWGGLHGSIYAFENPVGESNTNDDVETLDNVSSHKTTNFGASLGIDQSCDPCAGGVSYDLGVGYLYNMIGVNDIQYAVSAHRIAIAGTPFIGNGYNSRVGGIAAYGDLMSGPFSIGARYTTALQHFSRVDLVTTIGGTSGARPWAADITGGYNFNCWMNRNQNVYLGYQASRDSVEIMLPKSRWLAGYNVDVWHRTNLGLEYYHDTDYSRGNGGTGSSANSLALRVAVKFG